MSNLNLIKPPQQSGVSLAFIPNKYRVVIATILAWVFVVCLIEEIRGTTVGIVFLLSIVFALMSGLGFVYEQTNSLRLLFRSLIKSIITPTLITVGGVFIFTTLLFKIGVLSVEWWTLVLSPLLAVVYVMFFSFVALLRRRFNL
mgnify:CR=1 FL=1